MSNKHIGQKSLKRKQEVLDQTINDFEDEQLNFRYPKRALVESGTSTNDSKRRGRPKKVSSTKSGASQKTFSQSSSHSSGTKEKIVFANSQKNTNTLTTAIICKDVSPLNTCEHNSPSHSKEEDYSDLSELEKSVCSSAEKLCPTCKCIVLLDEYPSHVSTCLRKFSYSKNGKETHGEKNSRILPCPVCLKNFTSTAEKHSHVKVCGLNHGLSTEQLILAARLQEKQDEERLALGLPSPQLIQAESGIRKKSVPRTGNKKSSDPDLELAYALSRSFAEEERKIREREEDKLISLGLHGVIQENRRKLILPQPPPLPISGKGSRSGKGKKKAVIQTPLMTRTKEERERIITEKVAAILMGEMDLGVVCLESTNPWPDRLPGPLNPLEDMESTLWNFAGTGVEVSLESYFVPEFKKYIKPQMIPVGELFKSYSKVPGRLNYTALVEDSDEEKMDDENEEGIETTIVDAYCTQLALAELLCTQELDDFTFSVEDDSGEKEGVECAKEVEEDSNNASKIEDVEMDDVSHSPKNILVNNEKIISEKEEETNDNCMNDTEIEEDNLNAKELKRKDSSISSENILETGIEIQEKEKITNKIDDDIKDEEDLSNQTLIYNMSCQSGEGELEDIREEEPNDEIPVVDLSSGEETESTCSFKSNLLAPNNKDLGQAGSRFYLSPSESKQTTKTLPEISLGPSFPLSSLPNRQKDSENSNSALHSKLVYDWSSLLASGDHSDTIILASDGEIPVHFLVLSVRCPEILKEISENDPIKAPERGNKKYINWAEINYESAYAFVVYLYSGVSSVKSKESDSWLGLYDLSIKYKCTELVEYLESVYKSSPLKEIPNRIHSPQESVSICVDSPLSNSQNGNVINLNKICHRSRVAIIHSQIASPDIFDDWDDGEQTRNFIDSPIMTPPGSNIRECLLKSFKSPVLNLDDSLPSLDRDDNAERKEVEVKEKYCTLLEKKSNFPLNEMETCIVEKDVEISRHKDTNCIIGRDKDTPCHNLKENVSDLPQLGNEMACISLLKGSIGAVKEMTGIEERISSSPKPVIRRNLSYEFKELCYPSRNVEHCFSPRNAELCSPSRDVDPCSPSKNIEPCSPLKNMEHNSPPSNMDHGSPSKNMDYCSPRNTEHCTPSKNFASPINETFESEKLQLSPFSDVNYPSGDEFVDLTISSDNSESECAKTSPKSPESKHLNKGDRENRDIQLSTDSPARFSALFDKPIQNHFKSGKDLEKNCESNNPELSVFKEYPTVEKFAVSRISKENSYSSLLNDLTSKSKSQKSTSSKSKSTSSMSKSTSSESKSTSLESKSMSSVSKSMSLESNRRNNSFDNVSDESLLKAVCSVEEGVINGKPKPKFETPRQKFFKSKSCNVPSSDAFRSPHERNQILASSKVDITPMPDYKTMMSPELKKELDKYGIRKLSRKKAVTLLLHIYDQMHPLVTDSEAETSFAETPLRNQASVASENEKKENKKRKGKGKCTKIQSSLDNELNSSQTSNTSAESGFECLEETVYPDSPEEGDAITPTQQMSLETRIKTFIRSDADLYSKILCYEPIWANELLKDLKSNGIKCGLAKLITVLDEQCITFRIPTRERTRKRARKNSSPDKIPRKRKTSKNK